MSSFALADVFGVIAALCLLAAFNCRHLILLRCLSLMGSVFFIVYASIIGLMPVLILHLILLPLNALRLADCLRCRAMLAKGVAHQRGSKTDDVTSGNRGAAS
jgi:hypothetical protein